MRETLNVFSRPSRRRRRGKIDRAGFVPEERHPPFSPLYLFISEISSWSQVHVTERLVSLSVLLIFATKSVQRFLMHDYHTVAHG